MGGGGFLWKHLIKNQENSPNTNEIFFDKKDEKCGHPSISN